MKLSSATIRRPAAAFTMIEVAICLAIIGIALVGIIGVLPRGMNTQRDNREMTIIGQDANQLIEIIRNGARGQDDLTNYVFAVTNYWYWQNDNGSGFATNSYTYQNATVSGSTPSPLNPYAVVSPITNALNIVSLLSTPEFTDFNGAPVPSFAQGGISNHVVAYVRALSGLAAEKPPQTNDVMVGDSFSYRVQCVNAPAPLNLPPLWNSSLTCTNSQIVYWNYKQWMWVGQNTSPPGTIPDSTTGLSTNWVRCNVVTDQLSYSQREIRLRFLWPILPNGKVGNNYQNFRTTVGGQLVVTNNSLIPQLLLYHYQPQSFVQIP